MEVEARFEERAGRRVITRLIIEADLIDAAVLKKVPLRQLETRANAAQGHRPARIRWSDAAPLPAPLRRPIGLSRPDGTDPAGFARQVAQAYREVVKTTHLAGRRARRGGGRTGDDRAPVDQGSPSARVPTAGEEGAGRMSSTEPDPYLIALSEDGLEALSLDMADGPRWAAYHSPETKAENATVLLRVDGPLSGPLSIRELRAANASSTLLRAIPFMRIEAAINHPEHRAALAGGLKHAAIDGHAPGGTRYLNPPGSAVIAPQDLAVTDPGGYRKPDSFYRHVADRYLQRAAVSARPALDIAEANGVPAATVHRWIREAKARGLLVLPTHR